MCDCENIEMGSYDNQVFVPSPDHMPKDNGYSIDKCILEEILELWSKGIKTTGCCCGHNKLWPYIGVLPEYEDKMIELGYEVQFNITRPCDKDTFWPKSVEADPNNILRFHHRHTGQLKLEIQKLMRGKQ